MNTTITKKLRNTVFSGLLLMLGGVAANAQYCTPTNTNTTTSYSISNFSTAGGVTNISNMNSGLSPGGYGNFTTTQIVTSAPGQSFTFSGSFPSGYTFGVKIWVDWNGDQTFAATEQVFATTSYISTFSGTITVPSTGTVGVTRLRVGAHYLNSAGPATACEISNYIEFEDYTVILAPDNNAAAGNVLTPDPSSPFCSNSSQAVTASIFNKGGNALNSVNVAWTVDGVPQVPVNVTTPLPAYGDSLVVTLGNVFFADNSAKNIKFWTTQPNGVTDSKNSDDTATKAVSAALAGLELNVTPADTTICSGNTLTVNAGSFPNNPIYIWSNGQILQSIDISTPGMYTVFVQNTDGCYDRDTVNVAVHPNPVANSIAINDLGSGSFQFGILGANNIDRYDWDFGDGNLQDDAGASISHPYATSGEYTVTVTMSNQCGEITIVRVLDVNVGGTGLNDVKGLAKDLKMYPNPSRDKVTITHNGSIKMKHIELFSLMGQKVYSEDVNADKQEINLSNLASGIYNVVIDTDKGKATKKLEVIR